MPNKSLESYKLKRNTEDRIKTPKTPLKNNYIDISKYYDTYDVIEKIGSGDYCDVYLVKHKEKYKDEHKKKYKDNLKVINNINIDKCVEKSNDKCIHKVKHNDKRNICMLAEAKRNLNHEETSTNDINNSLRNTKYLKNYDNLNNLQSNKIIDNVFENCELTDNNLLNRKNQNLAKNNSFNSLDFYNGKPHTNNIKNNESSFKKITNKDQKPIKEKSNACFENVFFSDTKSSLPLKRDYNKRKPTPHFNNNTFNKNIKQNTSSVLPFYRNSLPNIIPSTPITTRPSIFQHTSTQPFCHSASLTCIKILYTKLTDPNRTQEVDILTKLKGHPHILSIISHSTTPNLSIETEYCGFGTLKQLITKIYINEKSLFSNTLIYKIMYEVASALCHIHRNNIIHMDLKPENIFIRSEYSVCPNDCNCYNNFLADVVNNKINHFKFVVGDFNISIYGNSEMDEDGDKKYMPPEILVNQATWSSDVYSLGLMFLEMITGIELPEKGSQWMGLRKNKFDMINWGGVSENDRRLCIKMIDKNWRKRIGPEEVLKYFERMDNV